MAVVGHWSSLAEAEKFTISELLQGIIETVIETGHLQPMLPPKQITGKSLLYNREKSWTSSAGAAFYDIHEQIPWTSDDDATQVETALRRIARQDAVDKFLRATYNNINDYNALVVANVVKKVNRFVEDSLIYGDITYGAANQFDGLHALNAEIETPTAAGSLVAQELNIDNANAVLSLATLRHLLDSCKVDQRGRDGVAILMPRVLARRFDAGYQEAGFVRASVTVSPLNVVIGAKDIGTRIMMFDGVPIIRSDFMVAEQADTGTGSSTDKRTKYTSGTRNYSLFVVRLGQTEDGGLSMLYGADSAADGEFKGFMHDEFEKLENFDAGGHRVVSYLAPALGAQFSLGRIFDIIDGAITP